jgi:hypothetical protein
MLLCCIDWVPPTSYVATWTPGISFASDHGSRPVGTPSRMAWFITVCWTFDLVSTVGDSPVTVIDSDTLPTSSFTLIVGHERRVDDDAFAKDPLKPCSSNLTA